MTNYLPFKKIVDCLFYLKFYYHSNSLMKTKSESHLDLTQSMPRVKSKPAHWAKNILSSHKKKIINIRKYTNLEIDKTQKYKKISKRMNVKP